MWGRCFQGPTIKITVKNRSETAEYHIHKSLLQERSPYFRAIEKFKEGQENHIDLDGIDLAAFEDIVCWLYTESFSLTLTDYTGSIVDAYAIADRLVLGKCKNMLIDRLRQCFQDVKSSVTILKLVHEYGYSSDSLLASYITDQLAHDTMTCEDWAIGQEDGEEQFCKDGGSWCLR